MNTSLYLPHPCKYNIVCDILGLCPLICYLLTKSFELGGNVCVWYRWVLAKDIFLKTAGRENRIPLLKILLKYIYFVIQETPIIGHVRGD